MKELLISRGIVVPVLTILILVPECRAQAAEPAGTQLVAAAGQKGGRAVIDAQIRALEARGAAHDRAARLATLPEKSRKATEALVQALEAKAAAQQKLATVIEGGEDPGAAQAEVARTDAAVAAASAELNVVEQIDVDVAAVTAAASAAEKASPAVKAAIEAQVEALKERISANERLEAAMREGAADRVKAAQDEVRTASDRVGMVSNVLKTITAAAGTRAQVETVNAAYNAATGGLKEALGARSTALQGVAAAQDRIAAALGAGQVEQKKAAEADAARFAQAASNAASAEKVWTQIEGIQKSIARLTTETAATAGPARAALEAHTAALQAEVGALEAVSSAVLGGNTEQVTTTKAAADAAHERSTRTFESVSAQRTVEAIHGEWRRVAATSAAATPKLKESIDAYVATLKTNSEAHASLLAALQSGEAPAIEAAKAQITQASGAAKAAKSILEVRGAISEIESRVAKLESELAQATSSVLKEAGTEYVRALKAESAALEKHATVLTGGDAGAVKAVDAELAKARAATAITRDLFVLAQRSATYEVEVSKAQEASTSAAPGEQEVMKGLVAALQVRSSVLEKLLAATRTSDADQLKVLQQELAAAARAVDRSRATIDVQKAINSIQQEIVKTEAASVTAKEKSKEALLNQLTARRACVAAREKLIAALRGSDDDAVKAAQAEVKAADDRSVQAASAARTLTAIEATNAEMEKVNASFVTATGKVKDAIAAYITLLQAKAAAEERLAAAQLRGAEDETVAARAALSQAAEAAKRAGDAIAFRANEAKYEAAGPLEKFQKEHQKAAEPELAELVAARTAAAQAQAKVAELLTAPASKTEIEDAIDDATLAAQEADEVANASFLTANELAQRLAALGEATPSEASSAAAERLRGLDRERVAALRQQITAAAKARKLARRRAAALNQLDQLIKTEKAGAATASRQQPVAGTPVPPAPRPVRAAVPAAGVPAIAPLPARPALAPSPRAARSVRPAVAPPARKRQATEDGE